MNVISIKAYFCKQNGSVKEIRRFTIPRDTTFSKLQQQIQKTFFIDDVSLEYADPENDMVMLASEEEWSECIRIRDFFPDTKQLLRLYIKKQGKKQGKSEMFYEDNEKEPETPVLESSHFYYTGGSNNFHSSFLQDVKTEIPKLLKRILPKDFLLNMKSESLPEWLQPVINVLPKSGVPEVDVEVTLIGKAMFQRALDLMDEHQIEEACQLLQEVCNFQPSPLAFYNLACCFALLDDKANSITALSKAANLGFKNFEHALKDEDLYSLRKEEQFYNIIESMKLNDSSVSHFDVENLTNKKNEEQIVMEPKQKITEANEKELTRQAKCQEEVIAVEPIPQVADEIEVNCKEEAENAEEVIAVEPIPQVVNEIEVNCEEEAENAEEVIEVEPIPQVAEEIEVKCEGEAEKTESVDKISRDDALKKDMDQYAIQLTLLLGMGFLDVQNNIRALKETKGDIRYALELLL